MQAESRFIFESMKYKIVMAVGAFAVLVNVTACVVNIVRGLGFMQSVGDFLSLFAVCLAMYAFYRCKQYVEIIIEYMAENATLNATLKTMLKKDIPDNENRNGIYSVREFSNMFIVSKSVDGFEAFVVRTFPYEKGDDASRKKARLRAYSLLNHITDNGKLWRAESK